MSRLASRLVQRYSSAFSTTRRALSSSKRRVAIVGSGPSGCYTAKYLSKADSDIHIDVLEALPVPYGLVRYGVAPDHPEVKNVQHDFDSLFDDSVRYMGNVSVGTDVTVDELRQHYDATVLAYGCQGNKSLLQGPGVLSAQAFVNWYNGHPDYTHIEGLAEILAKPHPRVVIVGQGNVALDCARILCKGQDLYDTDLAQHALEVLRGVHSVTLVGRRGPAQFAGTIKEIRELTRLENNKLELLKEDLVLNAASEEELTRPKKRILQLFQDYAQDELKEEDRTVALRFFLSPLRLERADDGSLIGLVCQSTTLAGPAGSQKAILQQDEVMLPADLILESIGYESTVICDTIRSFYDGRHFHHVNGRLTGPTQEMGGLYVTGWIKRGPSGIIGSNIPDAKETATSVLEDLSLKETMLPELDMIDILQARKVQTVDWDGYRRIEAEELRRRRSESQPREKIVDRESMLRIASEL